MISKKDTISMRQLIFIFMMLLGSPAIRYVPSYSSGISKQASWLSPIVPFFLLILLLLVYKSFFSKYKNASFLKINEIVLGKVCGTIVNSIYFVWITLTISLYLRYFSNRIVTTIFPNTNYMLFSAILLIVVAFTLRSGLSVFARMIEIFMPLIIVAFILLIVFITPEISVKNFFPLTYKDILPVLHAGLGTTAILGYITFVLIMGDRVPDKRNFFKIGRRASLVSFVLIVLCVLAPIGVFGWKVTTKFSLPFFATIKDLSLFGIIERFEVAVIAIWQLTDFTIVTMFSFAGLHIMKKTFKIYDEKSLINVYLVIVFVLTLYLVNNNAEIKVLSNAIYAPVNTVLGFVVPFLVFFIGKIRKKI